MGSLKRPPQDWLVVWLIGLTSCMAEGVEPGRAAHGGPGRLDMAESVPESTGQARGRPGRLSREVPIFPGLPGPL
ncbi:hypothetical protein GCM10009016_17410 [Halomonas beimenensis]